MADGRHREYRFWAVIWVDKHICTKFSIQMEYQRPKETHSPEIKFWKIPHGGQPPS